MINCLKCNVTSDIIILLNYRQNDNVSVFTTTTSD